MKQMRVVAIVVTLLVALVAACGGDDAESPTATSEPTVRFGDGATPPASPSHSPSASPGATPTATHLTAPTLTADPTATATPQAEPTPARPLGEWGNAEIYVMNADGSDQRRLTNMPTGEVYPAWSPDGSMLAFVSFESSQGRLYVMDANGTNVRWLSDAATTRPVWSPDGTQIAVVTGHGFEGGYHEIYIVAVDGSGEQRLTNFENVPTATLSMGNDSPVWSPDGERIAFISHQQDGPNELYVMNADGTGVQRLTDSQGNKWGPDWSPDGKRIAFVHNNPDPEIWTVNADGSGLQRVTASPTHALVPKWSPEGGLIAFVSVSDAGVEIAVVNPNGAAPRVIASGLSGVEHLEWSPNGQRVAFARDHSMGNSDIYTANADGSGPQQLTDAPHGDGSPVWSPDGSRIAFSSNRDGGQPVECNWGVISDYAAIGSVESVIWSDHVIVAGTIVEEHGPAFGGPLDPERSPDPAIYTDYTLDVERQFRGHPLETVRLRTHGGMIGDCEQTYQPEVRFTEGMRVLLFLGPETPDAVLPPAYFADVVGNWNVSVDDTIVSPNSSHNPEGVIGLTLAEVATLVAETLSSDPPSDAFYVVSIEDSPATPQ